MRGTGIGINQRVIANGSVRLPVVKNINAAVFCSAFSVQAFNHRIICAKGIVFVYVVVESRFLAHRRSFERCVYTLVN